ncbi:histidinol-phosphate/aromatic aminotransferase/cobyric acid decarboxylase-like protein [Krasilnikovia cinnamomea]|uniref:Aminotransferase n=1 Tax=Krasilnikovia cinnamomea TaxID=349313 RepID=A0A4Q7ZSA3_9ACTN|nr:histidinol-phosphate aminotransferase family protein [Krasilnikovia cinnamomea]RZU54058.1 histidinol-phosphate/aromatic aminotransferase/cobyric acid decarboxylase-like protein [Krasilnikovia cinnamomea]
MVAARLGLRLGTPADRDWIHRLRHEVYAQELGQHAVVPAGRLSDALDERGVVYLVATSGGTPAGFVSITPPWVGQWSLDKYLSRAELPALDAADAFEIRILTVAAPWRGTAVASLLMYAALRWVQSRGGRQVLAMGRTDLADMYRAAGLRPTGHTVVSGAVTFEVMSARVDALATRARQRYGPVLARLGADLDWRLDMPVHPGADGCAHGGASFDGIGADFRRLHRRREVVAADVLDAWFPPAPGVLDVLAEDPGWHARTSPPVAADGLRAEIAAARGVPTGALTLGAGSSDLIFRAFREWLTPASRVLLIDPTYGEYAHVTTEVIGCRVDRLPIGPADGWRIDVDRLAGALAGGAYDLAVVVNPNNPTGGRLPLEVMRDLIARVPARTRLWIDEAYVGYAGLDQSLAPLAAERSNIVVCTSMSKMYALSGMRVAYLTSDETTAAALRRWTPPWAVSLPAQLAAVAALRDPAYYAARWAQTAVLRAELAASLRAVDPAARVEPAVANFLLVTLPAQGPSAAEVVARCRRDDVYLRDLSPMSPAFQGRTIRIAVKDPAANARIVAAYQAALAAPGAGVVPPGLAVSRDAAAPRRDGRCSPATAADNRVAGPAAR